MLEKLHFSLTAFFAAFAKILVKLSVKFRGWDGLNLIINLLQTKCSDFRFNLTKQNTQYMSCQCCSFQIDSDLMKLDVINKTA